MIRHGRLGDIGRTSLFAPAPLPVRHPGLSHTICVVRLLERAGDMAALPAPWERARAGRGGLAVVAGEAGAGKSTLLQTFADDHVEGVPVLWGACDPLSLPRPLGPLHDVADQLELPRSV